MVTRDAETGLENIAKVDSIEQVFKGVALGQVNAREALTSLDVYTTQLAERVVQHEYNLTAADSQALEQIRRYIGGLFNTSELQFREDQEEVNSAEEAIAKCSSDALSKLNGQVAAWETETSNARFNHTSCRADQVSLTDTQTSICAAYDSYRASSDAVPPACVPTELTEQYITTADETELSAMEVCLVKTEKWFNPLYEEYLKCDKADTDVADEKAKCDDKQKTFENYFCSWVDHYDTTCDHQDACRGNEINFRAATEARVKAAEAARKADWTTGKHVECLFGVFEAANVDKQNTLSGCLRRIYSLDGITINYPGIPPATACTRKVAKPCNGLFTTAEYVQTSWFAKAPAATCRPCVSVR